MDGHGPKMSPEVSAGQEPSCLSHHYILPGSALARRWNQGQDEPWNAGTLTGDAGVLHSVSQLL